METELGTKCFELFLLRLLWLLELAFRPEVLIIFFFWRILLSNKVILIFFSIY